MTSFAARLEPAGRLPSRRDWLRLGIPATLAPWLSQPATASPVRPDPSRPGFGQAKSVLVVFTSGGQSQLESWDPKPDAPVEARGAFGSITTKVAGVRVCEHLPRLAALADRYTILRTMEHDDRDHGSACYLALTGQYHPQKSSNPSPQGSDMPTLGAVLHRVRPDGRFPHSAFHVNGPLLVPQTPAPGQNGGILGQGFAPLELADVTRGTALLDGMTLPADMPASRLDSRHKLVGQLETAGRVGTRMPGTAGQSALTAKAYDLLNSPHVRDAFDIEREPRKVRDQYGRYRAGQACLMGRRLVEAGVPWVTVFFNHNIRGQESAFGVTDQYGWDTHNDIFEDLRDHLLPRFDFSVSTLLTDLEQRGLLKHTLVVIMGEFGRAPLVQIEKTFSSRGSPGRKHWPGCYSVVLAGAGVQAGAVYGKSDRLAAYPAANPVSPGDLAATLFHALGIDANTHFTDLTNRPQRIVTGEPVLKLFG